MTTQRDIRIVFMGTPDFAVATLKALIASNYTIVGVITAPDKPAGRGRKLNTSAVKTFAVENQLNVLQPTNLKDPDFIKTLEALRANLQIVVAFRMLPKVVWNMPEYGTFNLHASLLPQYRGAAPIHWAIINGEQSTGVTTFFIDEKIDTGAIISQKEVAIADDETVGELHDKLMDVGSTLVIDTVKQIENDTVITTIQPKSTELKTAYKLNKDNCKIDWNAPLQYIYNKIRGLNPFPAAWCYLQQNEEELAVKLYDIDAIEEVHNHDHGKILVDKTSIRVACENGYIKIKTIQLPGKRKMDVKALLNGFKFSESSKLC